jgi:ergothioneine biosynthesis protein EgtB
MSTSTMHIDIRNTSRETLEESSRSAAQTLLERYRRTRARSEELIAGLSDADATAQSMPDASPVKWHLAHTTWFFETFVLQEHVPGYIPFDSRYPYLFNSYYEAKGPRILRGSRGLLTRPTLEEILSYRAYVDAAISKVWESISVCAQDVTILGCHHEQQHQELLLTDILHLFAQNPLFPAVHARTSVELCKTPESLKWLRGRKGQVQIGHDGDGFAFDCEGPRHTAWLTPHDLASRLVTNAEWLAFVIDGGYSKADHWLSDGWAWVRENDINAPLYWLKNSGNEWSRQFSLNGILSLNPDTPVCHVSYYEADAFARWAGYRLPTETEWESAAVDQSSEFRVNFDRFRWDQDRADADRHMDLSDLRWEWTASSFLPYPGFRAPPGAVGEYNGKFMSGQFVLRGGSCATPIGHTRATYRNFFYPHQRWQFTGVRLARDI